MTDTHYYVFTGLSEKCGRLAENFTSSFISPYPAGMHIHEVGPHFITVVVVVVDIA